MNKPFLLPVEIYARRHRLTRHQVSGRIRTGKLRHIRIGAKRLLIVGPWPKPSQRGLAPKDVAELTGCGMTTVMSLIWSGGDFPAYKRERAWVIRHDRLIAWLKAQEVGA